MNEPQTGELPQRVVKLIEAHEAESERLIGWVQVVIGAALWALYLIAPRPHDAPMPMLLEPVPLALFAYGGFTLLRLIVSHSRAMPKWLVLISILADTAMLLGLIWAFHAQYGQSAAFSLKVPTFIYFFVFIALRALRFDHRLVLAAGLAGALGWAILVMGVLYSERDGVVTRSFHEYLNGNRILIGAEVEKILILLLVSALLGFAILRARNMLIMAIRERAESVEIKRFIPRSVANVITSADETLVAGQAKERLAAIMMLDIRGFTSYSKQVSPREAVLLLTSLHARLVPIVEAHGGIVDKFLGDGIMVTFGAVEPSQTAAADALRALEAVMREAENWRAGLDGLGMKHDLQVNGALAAGSVVFATLGSADRLEYTVVGEAVNLAAKLEKHNKVLGVQAIISRQCFALARQQGFLLAQDKSDSPGQLFDLVRYPDEQVAGVTDRVDIMALHRRDQKGPPTPRSTGKPASAHH